MTRLRGAISFLIAMTSLGCGGSVTDPLPRNVVVAVSPRLVGSFASLGGTHTFRASVADTLGNPLMLAITWDVVPAAGSVAVSGDGVVTVSPSAAPGDYRVRATANRISDTVIVRVLPRPSGKLVFSATTAGGGQVFVKDFAIDGDAVQLTDTPGTIAGLAVEQATGAIFFSKGALPNVDLFRMAGDGSALVNLTNDVTVSNQGPALHPTTSDIYFTRRGLTGTTVQVFRMRQDGTDLTQLTTSTQSKITPAISPDGRSLAWSETFSPGTNIEVVTSSITGADPVRFTDRAGTDAPPYWASNTRLVWGSSNSGQFDIYSATLPGPATATNLTNGAGASSQPSASCTPNTVTILRSSGGEIAVYQLDLGTGLAVKYALPASRSITFARRQC
jgi:hypothetical protein